MGYNVEIQDSTFKIPLKNKDEAYNRLCQLNYKIHNNQKMGGSYPKKTTECPEYGPHESSWFSWMEWNYHETCSDLVEILNELGFDVSQDEEYIKIDYYSSKSGQEGLFLKEISNLSEGHIIWRGEDGEFWVEVYGEDEVKQKTVNITEMIINSL